MSAIRPLRDETQSDFARELLESAGADHSAPGASHRALAAFGLGAGAMLATGLAAGATAAAEEGAGISAGALGAGSLAPKALVKVSALVIAKWVGVGVLSGVAAVGSAEYVQRPAAQPASAMVSTPRPTGATGKAAHGPEIAAPSIATAISDSPSRPLGETGLAPQEARRALEPTRRANDLPVADPNVAEPNAAEPVIGVPGANGGVAPADPGTMQQLATLGIIRRLIASGDPTRALVWLDDFDRTHPSTPLKEEVTVLRIDALTDLGRSSDATALATAFLRANPDSAYTRRVRSKLKLP